MILTNRQLVYLAVGALMVVLLVAGTIVIYPRRSEPKPQEKLVEKLSLEEYLVALDPGHGGIDGGSEYGSLKEKEITLAVAEKVGKNLSKLGSKVMLTREADNDISRLYPEERTRQRRDLMARVKVAQEENADVLVSIHVNAAQASFKGPMVFYQKNSSDSKRLAETLLAELRKVSRHHQQDLIPANYFILKQASIPAVLVELGFITNIEERNQLQTEDYQQELALAIAKGINRYLQFTDGDIPGEIKSVRQ
ncbi:N-acetylmuramoyl-L-alanine amidase [Metallumcola ferriviriculae]|uniref:N-acetylmuramoyl-L-alanine amidase n=1 Tax=Metallumcola ferriviriculae TaxID=3039180 RepID=A0AAU0UI91_9FIRM|nr:N-acetylmuramoyl-L-alanine amidase [Desulfitibacteraceae bacterium MK1]